MKESESMNQPRYTVLVPYSTAIRLCIKHKGKGCHKNAKQDRLCGRHLTDAVTEQWIHFVLML